MGYHRAGFDVTGVDIAPQKNYPFTCHQGDALEFVARHGHEYDAIAASPVCKRYTRAATINGRAAHPDQIAATRAALRATGRPYVIENVPTAPLIAPVTLCGAMFGLRTYRHRLFECSFFLLTPDHPHHRWPVVKMGRKPAPDQFINPVGHFNGVETARAALGIDWMTRDELAQAIPPAYTHLIGTALLAHLQHTERAA
jgi:DNA (cytosine-5)-methyltransferase 1